jgi:hypothetical protein
MSRRHEGLADGYTAATDLAEGILAAVDVEPIANQVRVDSPC